LQPAAHTDALTLVWQQNVTGVGIGEVGYEIKNTESASNESSGAGCDECRQEQSIIA